MEIGTRKKNTAERGIKLTVVLMASRRMLGEFILELDVVSLQLKSPRTIR